MPQAATMGKALWRDACVKKLSKGFVTPGSSVTLRQPYD
jgi:hypothetical protein